MDSGNNYPFSDAMVFCSRHSKESDVIDVDKCQECCAADERIIRVESWPNQFPDAGSRMGNHQALENDRPCWQHNNVSRLRLSASLDEFDPSQDETPCWNRPVWLSKLRQIALIEAAEELNERFHDVTNDRFNPQYESYVLPKGGR